MRLFGRRCRDHRAGQAGAWNYDVIHGVVLYHAGSVAVAKDEEEMKQAAWRYGAAKFHLHRQWPFQGQPDTTEVR